MAEDLDFWNNMDYFNGNLTEEEKALYMDQLLNNFSKEFNLDEIMDFRGVLKEDGWRTFIITLYGIIIIAGFLENLLVIIVMALNKNLHTVTNIFIVTLAWSDIFLCVFNLPFQLHFALSDYWAFGEVLCHIIMSTFGVPIFVSTGIMLMIAIDRYILIVYPFRKRMSKLMALILILIIVFLTIGFSSPVIFYTKYTILEEAIPGYKSRPFCYEEGWPTQQSRQIYTISVFVVQFVCPLLVLSLLYCKIYEVLRNRPLKRSETRRNYKTVKILISIVLTFTISFLPWNTFGLINEFNPYAVLSLKDYKKLTDLVLKIIKCSSACINPFLYGWLNDNFRREFSKLLGKNFKKHNRFNGYSTANYEPSKSMDAEKTEKYLIAQSAL